MQQVQYIKSSVEVCYYLLFYLFRLPLLGQEGLHLNHPMDHIMVSLLADGLHFPSAVLQVSSSSSFAGGRDCCASLGSGEGGVGGPCRSTGRIDLSRESSSSG